MQTIDGQLGVNRQPAHLEPAEENMSFSFPDFWWGSQDRALSQPSFTILSLLKGRLLSVETAALIWSLLARRASLIVVGGHYRGGGKTTTLSALTGFFPTDTDLAFTHGSSEDFAFVQTAEPRSTYIMVNELSNHTPWYLWDDKARRVFELTEQGYAFAGTLHAESIEEVVSTLMTPEVGLSPPVIARALQLVVMQAAFRTDEGIDRRVVALYWLQPAARGPGGLGIKSLGVWDQSQDRWYPFSSPDTWADLAAWARVDPESFRRDTEPRARYLEELLAGPEMDYDGVREALLAFRPPK